jgi:hypothetical protein
MSGIDIDHKKKDNRLDLARFQTLLTVEISVSPIKWNSDRPVLESLFEGTPSTSSQTRNT